MINEDDSDDSDDSGHEDDSDHSEGDNDNNEGDEDDEYNDTATTRSDNDIANCSITECMLQVIGDNESHTKSSVDKQ